MLEFKLSLEEANLIVQALGKLPYEVSASLISNISEQAKPQLQAKEVQKESPKKSK